MSTRKSLLTDTLNNEMKMIELVNEYDIKGEGDKIPKKVRERYDIIMKSIKNHDNNYDDDDFEKQMKMIEAVTKQNRSASRKKSSRRGGKTKRKRRTRYKKKATFL